LYAGTLLRDGLILVLQALDVFLLFEALAAVNFWELLCLVETATASAVAVTVDQRYSSHAWHKNRSPTVLRTVLSFLLSGHCPFFGRFWHLILCQSNVIKI